MINIAKEKNPMPEQEPMIRNKNFLEVCEGYTEEMAIREAMRCLRCRKKPCMMVGCPVHNHIPDFIAKVAEGDFEAAYQVLAETTSLPAVCGRVCPQEAVRGKLCTRYQGTAGRYRQPGAFRGRLAQSSCGGSCSGSREQRT